MFLVGTAKVDITPEAKGVGMMGYGMWHNRVKGIETRLYARAFVFQEKGSTKKLAYVNAEFAFITIAIKKAVVKKLQSEQAQFNFTEQNVFLSAQHTHSAPGGYSEYALYNMSIPGFVPAVFNAFVDGITKAIVLASNKMESASMEICEGKFEPNKELAINRSVKAWNQNPEVEKITNDTSHLGVDTTMTLLKISKENDEVMGSVNWFGVHTTSVHNDNTKICSDNKGYAAEMMEKKFKSKNPEYIAAFAQRACGDISPNYFYDKQKKWTRGKHKNDFKSAAHNGSLQFEKAFEIHEKADTHKIEGPIDSILEYVDFSNIKVAPEFSHGDENAQTDFSCHGVAFFSGTLEGPGMHTILQKIATYISKKIKDKELKKIDEFDKQTQENILRKYAVHGKKDILLESGIGRLLGVTDIKSLPIPDFIDPSVATFKNHHRNGSLANKPLIPQILPLHIAQIGQVALIAVPGEITTVASWRLKNMLLPILNKKGINEIIVCSYTNAFCGYFTTYEEYQTQCYEGGHTVFGQHQLGALLTRYKKLAEQFILPHAERKIDTQTQPTYFPTEEIEKRTFNL